LAPGTPHRLAGAGRVTAWLVALVGLARILADFGLVPFTLDRFTYWNPIAPLTVTSRVAMNTAIAFVLLGSAFSALDGRIRNGGWLAQVPLLMVSAIALIALLGYLYGVPLMYGSPGVVAMAPHTAVSLLLISVGALSARRDSGLAGLVSSPTAG